MPTPPEHSASIQTNLRSFPENHATLRGREIHINKVDKLAMSFAQIMQPQTSKVDEIRGVNFIIVFSNSYEDVVRNSALPETDALAKKTMAFSDNPPVFYDLDLVRGTFLNR